MNESLSKLTAGLVKYKYALLVLVFSQKVRGMSMLLVIGIMVSYICSAVTDFCIAFAKEQDIVNLTTWGISRTATYARPPRS